MKMNNDPEWVQKKAASEDGQFVSVGVDTCSKCGLTLEVWSQYGELKGFCPDPNCDEVRDLGADPEW